MATEYTPIPPLPFADLVAALPCGSLRHERPKDVDEQFYDFTRHRVLTVDGVNFLWAFRLDDGSAQFTRFGRNDVKRILKHVAIKFKVEFPEMHQE